MAIEITEFANVSISVSPTGVQGGNFGILGFLATDADSVKAGKSILPSERYRAYKGLTSVAADWDASSDVYKAAVAFYGQTPTPTDFVVQMCYETAQGASLTGGGTGTADELKAAIIGTGANAAITLEMDALGSIAVTTLDLTSVASPATYDAIAVEVESQLDTAGLTGIAVTHNGYQFVVEGLATGTAGLLSFGTGGAAELLGLQVHQSILSQGIDAESPVDALLAADDKGIVAVGLVTDKKWRDVFPIGTGGDTTEEIAIYAEAAKRIFCNTSNDLSCLTSYNDANPTDIIHLLKARTLRFCLSTFSKDVNAYPSASVFGRAASVNFDSVDSTITLNLKQMPGIAAENLTPNEFANLRARFGSAVVQIGTGVNARNGFTDSRMSSGSWLDTTHGLLWLENRCEVDMFNLLYVNNTKIPFTQVGINTSVAKLESSLEAAVRNGLAAPGYLPDGTFLPKGYIVTAVSLEDTPSSDKSNRVYSGLSFKMVGAGALHAIEISGEYSE